MTYDLYKKYGEFRLLDTPICEYSFMVCSPVAACAAVLPLFCVRLRRAALHDS